MAKVRMLNMIFYGFQGIYEYEREQGAKLMVDVEMTTWDDKAGDTDDPEDGIDCAVIYPIVRDAVEESKCNLMMKMASNVAKHVLKRTKRIAEVTVRIRKQAVPISGPLDYLEVEMTRKATKH